MRRPGKRAFLIPEVIQSSAMDCGPACLKAFLEGFGVPVSYGRLREACQTDVDGSSIDAIEETAVRLGLQAEQRVVPLDHLLLAESGSLPAMAVTLTSSGTAHFVVVWRRHGNWLQVMDPGSGRQWIRCGAFLARLLPHEQAVPAADWREWASSEVFQRTLRRRMADIGIRSSRQKLLLGAALRNEAWEPLAALDAAVRMTAALAAAHALRTGGEAERVVDVLAAAPASIPRQYWPVQATPEDTGTLVLRGAVIMQASSYEAPASLEGLSTELASALREPKIRPLMELWKITRAEGVPIAAALALTAALAPAGVIVETLLYRSLVDIGGRFPLTGQRMAAMGAVTVYLSAMLMFEWPLEEAFLRLCRKLEDRFRIRFLEKLPRLSDRYFHSRLMSDMAERAHSVYLLRTFPSWAQQIIRAVSTLFFTIAGIAWLFPRSAGLAALVALASIAIPFLGLPSLQEREFRRREVQGALTLFFFDALKGLAAIRAHGAGFRLRCMYEERLTAWAGAGLRLHRAVTAVDALQTGVAYALTVVLVFRELQSESATAGILLLIYWALSIPALAQEVAGEVARYPRIRNILARLIEPLQAPQDEETENEQDGRRRERALRLHSTGVEIALEGVDVVAAGQTILAGIDLRVSPGEHIAVVGPSGAGKSTLAGLLLGWHRPARGYVRADGEILNASRIEKLRAETAWVDPEVYLWNQSLYENLTFGLAAGRADIAAALEASELDEVLRGLPEGLQTRTGEGGAFVSAGQGQRIRIGRALGREEVRLVILDEPTRGLERDRRRRLVQQIRQRWSAATLFCITHDVAETRGFPRVLVIDHGQIVEDGKPENLLRDDSSRYAGLLRDEQMVKNRLWSSPVWRRLRMKHGRIEENREDKPLAAHG